jgi:NAD(P)-dependent dehydrogenase (short-subunit alcohol dehydrogenase family)
VPDDALFSVQDQVVLVSGGSRGIGRAIALGFASRGAVTIATGTNEAALSEVRSLSGAEGHRLETAVCDVLDLKAIERTVGEVLDRHGRIDALINVAGINRRKPALDVSEDDWDAVLDVNLKGAFWMAKTVGKSMIERRSGSQVHVLSLNVDRPLRNVGPYAASKAALATLTRSLAEEWGPFGVRVNGLAPGFILTDLTRKLWSDPAMADWAEANTPLKRLGVPEDMVGTALFLASPAAAFLTGQVLYVDGGFTSAFSWPIPGFVEPDADSA